MLKKFTEGLIFGGGFAISFVVVWYVAAYLITPMFLETKFEEETTRKLSGLGVSAAPSSPAATEATGAPTVPFHELGLEDQIKTASVIALARYERGPDGKMKAVIKEFLKKDPGVTIYYNIGDDYPSASYVPKANTSYGDGVVIFFVGSPAMMRMSMSYSGDRIHGLGDLPVELLRNKCKQPGA